MTFSSVAVTLSLSYCQAGSVRGRSTSYSSKRGYYGSQQPSQPTQAPGLTPKEFLDKESGFSTFGIIAIIFVVIVGCLALYYGIMCYPFLCRDEKKYRFMDVSSTITAATSSSIQSIENYPDEKHGQINDVHSFK